MRIVTLTTDLGLTDSYAGAVKGALLNHSQNITIADISHHIKPFDSFHGAFVLKNAYPDFPQGTIHLINIEAEGKRNRYLLMKLDGHFFLGPDNGIFSLIVGNKQSEVFELPVEDPVAFTFPERDILAKFAAEIANGKAIEDIGRRIHNMESINILEPVIGENSIRGNVIYIDHYENAFVNITKELFEEKSNGRTYTIYFKRTENIRELSANYGDVPEGEKLAFFSSSGYLEIAINKGKAGSLFGLKPGDIIQVEFT